MKRLLLSLLVGLSSNLFGMEPEPQEQIDPSQKVILAIDAPELALFKGSEKIQSLIEIAKLNEKNTITLPIDKDGYDLLVPLLDGQNVFSDYDFRALIKLMVDADLLIMDDLSKKCRDELITQLKDPQVLSDFFKEYVMNDFKINLPDFMLNQLRASVDLDEIIKHMPIDLARTLKVNTDDARSVAYSPDGKYLASGTWDGTINIWDFNSGEMVKTLRGHTGAVGSVAYSPDDKYLASGSFDKTVRIWHVNSGETVKNLPTDNPMFSVAYSPDGKYLASGDYLGLIIIWDVTSGEKLTGLLGPISQVNSLAYSPNGKYLVSGYENGAILKWDVNSGKMLTCLLGHAHRVKSVAYSPDGEHLASLSFRNIIIWDVKRGEPVKELSKDTYGLVSVAYSPDGKYLVSASDDQTVKIWDLRNVNYIRMIATNNLYLPQLLLLNAWSSALSNKVSFNIIENIKFIEVAKKLPEDLQRLLLPEQKFDSAAE